MYVFRKMCPDHAARSPPHRHPAAGMKVVRRLCYHQSWVYGNRITTGQQTVTKGAKCLHVIYTTRNSRCAIFANSGTIGGEKHLEVIARIPEQ